MSDIDELEQWQAQKERNLARKAGLEDVEDDMDSEEEVMVIEDEDNNWGKHKSNYYGGADDQGDESAQEDEEEEALKLQERMANEMNEDDFFDEDDEDGWRMNATDGELEEEPEQHKDLSELDPAARLSLLEESYPEALLLAKELGKCKSAAEELESESGEVITIKKTALSSYMAMIYSYYALFTSQVQNGSVDLKEHPVMEGILKARELWRLASKLGVEAEEAEEAEEEEASGEEFGEIEAELEGEDAASDSGEEFGESGADSQDIEEDEEESESDSADEFAITMPGAKRPRASRKVHTDFDETADSVEQQARAKDKQSLRFYTSAIGKKNAPREDKFGGDLDLPYKERAFERRKRLQEEARLRGLEKKDRLGEDSGDEPDEVSVSQAPSNPIYNQAKAAATQKKADRQKMHQTNVEAALQRRAEEFEAENAEASDKRKISYQMQKNRGLTSKRAKINRNSRLKKRVRYEDAKKKLRGVRKEYKAPTGAYSGESRGIRKNVVHSTKF